MKSNLRTAALLATILGWWPGCSRRADVAIPEDAAPASQPTTTIGMSDSKGQHDGGLSEPSADAGGPTDTEDDFRWETYVFPESHPCLQRRPVGQVSRLDVAAPSTLPRSNAEQAFRQARRGVVQRVTLEAHGRFGSGCACLPFALSTDVAEFHDLKAVYLPGVRGRAYRERLDYKLVGYFTGRVIDLHEYYRSLHLPADWARRSEDTPDPDGKFPEFCLEAWCYMIPKTDTSNEGGQFLMSVSREHEAVLVKEGVPPCKIR